MEYKITKVRKYGKGLYQSEKIGNQWYNVVYARLYPNSNNKSTYYKVHFIHMFDGYDLWEHFNSGKEEFSNSDIKECRDELIWGMAESLFYGSDIKTIINECNETIEKYA